MNEFSHAQLINLLGFTIGIVMYALLLFMTLRHPLRESKTNRSQLNWLLLLTAVLGLFWNAGELFESVAHDFNVKLLPILAAISHTAFGFLPAVIVHLTVKSTNVKNLTVSRGTILISYALSGLAAVLQFLAAGSNDSELSNLALQILTFGYLFILAGLFLLTLWQPLKSRAVLAVGLAVFAVSAFHISRPQEESSFWIIEFIGHQSSLPLAFAILFQDFRFAFADLFLKRALSLLLLALTAFGLYTYAAAPLLAMHKIHGDSDSQPTLILLGFWIATALIYSYIHQFAVLIVDKILLQRANYAETRTRLAAKVARSETTESVLAAVCEDLKAVLTAQITTWKQLFARDSNENFQFVNFSENSAQVFVPTVEPPFYQISLQHLSGGRRLLSDEIELLSDISLLTARRIDALRASHERCEQEIREQEIGKLISEAELRALRAQLNPHFLFNALTTIGYLINTAPDKALATLMQLTQLLRGVLRSTGEFSTLGEEIKLIESYLEIEKARFEERLQIKIEIAPDLLKLRVPSLILQPLVENAVKHGISSKKNGGEVRIAAKIEQGNLLLEVSDTGAGVDKSKLNYQRQNGVGLNNIESRLRSHFGAKAELKIESELSEGTRSKISLPLKGARTSLSA